MISWDDKAAQIDKLIDERGDNGFKEWSVIQANMYVGEAPYIPQERTAVEYLLDLFPWADSNTLHQLYHLQQWFNLGLDIHSVNSVVEIGGGFGEMARIWRALGYQGKYTIYDLPALRRLQNLYFARHGVENIGETTLPLEADLLIACASLTEMDLATRERVMTDHNIGHLLLFYSDVWDEIDNHAYLASWQGRHIAHPYCPGLHYLVR